MKLIPTDEKGKLITYCGGLEKPKQETLEEAIEKYSEIYRCPATNENEYCRHDIISAINFGIKLQAERMYSEEDLCESFMACWKANVPDGVECKLSFKEWFNQNK